MSKLLWIVALSCVALRAGEQPLLVRGLHFFAPRKSELDACEKFIRESLTREGVNTLVIEFNYSFDYKSHSTIYYPYCSVLSTWYLSYYHH